METITPSFDPNDLAAIRTGLIADLTSRLGAIEFVEGPERFGDGMDTYIYALRLSGDVSSQWSAPLVLRVFPSMDQVDKAEREAAMQTFAAEKGIPAPKPLLVETSGAVLGLPFMIMERMPGLPMLSRIKNPLNIPGMLRTMAQLQAKLHSLPTDGCPVPYEQPLVDEWLAQSQDLVRKFRPEGLDRPLAWLEENVELVRDEKPVLTDTGGLRRRYNRCVVRRWLQEGWFFKAGGYPIWAWLVLYTVLGAFCLVIGLVSAAGDESETDAGDLIRTYFALGFTAGAVVVFGLAFLVRQWAGRWNLGANTLAVLGYIPLGLALTFWLGIVWIPLGPAVALFVLLGRIFGMFPPYWWSRVMPRFSGWF